LFSSLSFKRAPQGVPSTMCRPENAFRYAIGGRFPSPYQGIHTPDEEEHNKTKEDQPSGCVQTEAIDVAVEIRPKEFKATCHKAGCGCFLQ